MMAETIFIAGTDTDVGKTYVTCGLLRAFSQAGYRCVGLKPLASGAESSAMGWVNSDALALQQAASVDLPYAFVNPIVFPSPIAPHIAAAQQGEILSAQRLLAACQKGLNGPQQITLVEGVGGWLVPLNERETMADFAKALAAPVILVVAMRLGCLNHTMLSIEAIRASGLKFLGWVANNTQPDMLSYKDNLLYLKNKISEPCLAEVGYQQSLSITPRDMVAVLN